MSGNGPEPYGLVAEFERPDELVAAARAARREGFAELEGYSPFVVEELDEALGLEPSILPVLALAGGLLGAVGFFLLQTYAMVESYDFNIGGRPLFSWPSFILPSFAIGIAGAAVTTVVGMLILDGLPRLNHPIFEHEGFARATQDRFFLRIGPDRRGWDEERVRAFLETRHPLSLRMLHR